MEPIHARGCVYALQYHIVWVVKYRHKVISPEIEERLKSILFSIAREKQFTISEFNIDHDYVHILVECSPNHSIPDMVKAMKGVSARLLFKEFGTTLKQKLWGGHLWSPSYFVATVSENTEAQIREYIQDQKTK